MSTIDLQLPDELGTFVRVEAARRGFPNPSEFVQALLEAERHRQVRVDIEASLLDAVDGPFSEWTEDDLEEIRTTGRRMIGRRAAK
jgi:Arc/MetJ-type ribon-helix-helix transcriptional regulator